MYQFLCIFGPAAVTFLLVSRISRKASANYVVAITEVIAYAALDAGIMILILRPIGKIEFVYNEFGLNNLNYGYTAFFTSLIVAIITGVIIGIIMRHVGTQSKTNTAKRKGEL